MHLGYTQNAVRQTAAIIAVIRAFRIGLTKTSLYDSDCNKNEVFMQSDNDKEISKEIGRRIKYYRRLKGLTQGQAGSALGITSQQFQIYEVGENKISAIKLFKLHKLLDAPVEEFFPQEDDAVSSILNRDRRMDNDIFSMIEHFSSIKNEERRKALLGIVKDVSRLE